MAYQHGGWYDNPATGKNQRWWNGEFLPVGQTDPAPSGGGGNSGGGGGGGGGASQQSIEVPAFVFDWDAAEREALEKLTPYYLEKLKEAEGDVERAKKLIEEDYARGKRYREEDEKVALEADTTTAQEETRAVQEDLNKRGLLFGQQTNPNKSAAPFSEFASEMELNPLNKNQQARRLAIQRAIQRQEEVAGVERRRGIEEQDIAFPRYKKTLEQEKQDKAILQMAPLKYQQEYAKYQATVGRSLNPYLQRA